MDIFICTLNLILSIPITFLVICTSHTLFFFCQFKELLSTWPILVIKKLDGTINVSAILESLGPLILSPNWFTSGKSSTYFHCGKNWLDDLHLNHITNANFKDYNIIMNLLLL